MYNYQETVQMLNYTTIIFFIIAIAITLIIILSPIFIIKYLKRINKKLENIDNKIQKKDI